MTAEDAERLRKKVEDNALSEGAATTLRVTVSIGGAAFPNQDVENEDQLLQVADEALYRAKEQGRNRVALVT